MDTFCLYPDTPQLAQNKARPEESTDMKAETDLYQPSETLRFKQHFWARNGA
jgi:hypothetical protein